MKCPQPVQCKRAEERTRAHGLLIWKEPLAKILAGTKTSEIRCKATKRRGPIALIESESGQVVGVSEIVDVVLPLSRSCGRTRAEAASSLPASRTRRRTHGFFGVLGGFRSLCPTGIRRER
jgi:hypothetical protein